MKVTVISFLISALGTNPKDLEMGGRIKISQTTTLSRLTRILSRLLRNSGDLLSLTNAGEKKTLKNITIIIQRRRRRRSRIWECTWLFIMIYKRRKNDYGLEITYSLLNSLFVNYAQGYSSIVGVNSEKLPALSFTLTFFTSRDTPTNQIMQSP